MARPQATPRALAVARGDEPADTLITGGLVFADATREWIGTSLALAGGVIAGWGERDAREVIDVSGAALTPGFIDAHMHLESTKLWIDEFIATVLPMGTTAVAADPHELANVLGIPGILALMAAENIEQAVFVGTSMGGLITMVVGAFKPEAVAAAVHFGSRS